MLKLRADPIFLHGPRVPALHLRLLNIVSVLGLGLRVPLRGFRVVTIGFRCVGFRLEILGFGWPRGTSHEFPQMWFN